VPSQAPAPHIYYKYYYCHDYIGRHGLAVELLCAGRGFSRRNSSETRVRCRRRMRLKNTLINRIDSRRKQPLSGIYTRSQLYVDSSTKEKSRDLQSEPGYNMQYSKNNRISKGHGIERQSVPRYIIQYYDHIFLTENQSCVHSAQRWSYQDPTKVLPRVSDGPGNRGLCLVSLTF
jgi:hypothetical protein